MSFSPVQGPVVRFICRPDFVARVQMIDHPTTLLLGRSSVRHMINRIRRDASTFERYQHNRDLVCLLNTFACKERELPPGWESKKDKNGKVLQQLLKLTDIIVNVHFAISDFFH